MTTIHSVLFDLDGTLLDTAPEFVVSLNQLLSEHNRPTLPEPSIRATVSSGARALVNLAFDLSPDDPGFEPLRLRLLDIYEQQLGSASLLFSGLGELLLHLQQRDIPWGIVTNKPERFTTPLLAELKLRPDVVVCPDHVTHTKPHPEPLLAACKHLNIAPHRALYVGDHRRDIEAGNRAGMITIAANYGYIEADDPAHTWNAQHLINDGNELATLIKQHYQLQQPPAVNAKV